MEWISVKDQMPEFTSEGNRYHFTDTILATDGVNLYAGFFRLSKQFGFCKFVCMDIGNFPTGDDTTEILDATEITYWMPKPELPKRKRR